MALLPPRLLVRASILSAVAAAPLCAQDPPPRSPVRPTHAVVHFAAGFATSILAHEAGHFGSSFAMGFRPSFGFDHGRPTVYSGIDATSDPRQQLTFSTAGLAVQAVIDELLLDRPHSRGHGSASPFERGVLAGGIGTALFYITIGRNGDVSDVEWITRESGLSKTQVSLIVGGIATMHAVRIRRSGRYAHFFLFPTPDATRFGVTID